MALLEMEFPSVITQRTDNRMLWKDLMTQYRMLGVITKLTPAWRSALAPLSRGLALCSTE